MKKLGVPFTPLRTPPEKSLWIIGRKTQLAQRLLANSCMGRPSARVSVGEKRQAQLILILEELVMHLPKSPVRPRELGNLRGRFGKRVDLRQGEVPVREAQPWAIMRQHLADDGMRSPAMWALVVAIFDEKSPGRSDRGRGGGHAR